MATFRALATANNLPLPDAVPRAWDSSADAATPDEFRAFLAHLDHLFVGNPSLRITLVKCIHALLLARLDRCPLFVTSPGWTTLLRSLLLDVNAHLLAQSIKLVLVVIPHAAIHVATSVPHLLAVLVRVAVWKKRTRVTRIPQWGFADPGGAPVNTVPSTMGFLSSLSHTDTPRWSPGDPDESLMTTPIQAESLADITPPPKPTVGWRVAGAALVSTSSSVGEAWAQPPSVINPPTIPFPSQESPTTHDTLPAATNDAALAKLVALYNPTQDLSRGLLLEIYASWPGNVVALAKDPAAYLEQHVESPYAVGWGEVWRKKEVQDLLSTALAGFLFNPTILLSTPTQELADTTRLARTPTVELIAQGHALWLGSILPRAGGTSLLPPTGSGSGSAAAAGAGRTPAAWESAGRDASPTETLSSSGGSVTGRYHSTRGRDTTIGIGGGGAGPSGTYVSTQTAPINIRMGGKMHPVGGGGGVGAGAGAGVGGTGSGAGGSDNLQSEVDGLKREKEFLEMDLKYSKTLAASYLQHVYRLHEKVIAVITDEAERQNIYNQLKEQTATIRSLRDELRTQRAAVDRAKESIAKMQMEQRETRQIQREEKRARALETSTSRAEIEDQTRILAAQKLELARVKDAHFKLDNKLREAEPKIKHIADYEKQVDKLYHNQLLWDADIRKQKETESSLNKMMSAFKQMEIVLARYEKDKNALQAENQRQADRMVELQSEVSRLSEQLEAPKQLPEDIASTIRQDLEVLQTKLQDARRRIDTLERDKLELEARIEELEYHRMTAATAQATLL